MPDFSVEEAFQFRFFNFDLPFPLYHQRGFDRCCFKVSAFKNGVMSGGMGTLSAGAAEFPQRYCTYFKKIGDSMAGKARRSIFNQSVLKACLNLSKRHPGTSVYAGVFATVPR